MLTAIDLSGMRAWLCIAACGVALSG